VVCGGLAGRRWARGGTRHRRPNGGKVARARLQLSSHPLGGAGVAQFEIESILQLEAGVAVLARHLDAGEFSVGPASSLGGVPLREYLDIPRRILPDGSLDLKFFAFQLANTSDAPRLRVGQVVQLLP
jgi:hypothetical protein